MNLTLNLNENQVQQLKDALLLLEREKDLFSNKDFQNLVEQVYRQVPSKEGLDE